jgi:hypothetical protein
MTYAHLIDCAIYDRGRLTSSQIYSIVQKMAKRHSLPLSKNWKATVRNTLQRHCKQSTKFRPPYLFVYHGRNIWECRK